MLEYLQSIQLANRENLEKGFEAVSNVIPFIAILIIAVVFGQYLPKLLRWLLKITQSYLEINTEEVYDRYVQPVETWIVAIATLLFMALSFPFFIVLSSQLFEVVGFLICSALSIGLIWLAFTTAIRPKIRQFIIVLVKHWFGEVNEIVLVFETLFYITLVLIAFIIFFRGLGKDFFAIAVSVAGVAWIAQEPLKQMVATLELYLDRPYVAGEYIRITFNPHAEDLYGRIESIGLRSTKIRIVAHNTVMIVPNSMMAKSNIENISRGKKIMAILCLDFTRSLNERERALVRQIVNEESLIFHDLDRASIQIKFNDPKDSSLTRAQAIFFLTGSSKNSVELRKHLLNLANEAIAQRLITYNIFFKPPDPIVYIDSPMSI